MRIAVREALFSQRMPMSTPDLFTINEAATILRIGRTTAYEIARRDLATGGGEGLNVIQVGGQLRIPRVALERLTGDPIALPEDSQSPHAEPVAVPVTAGEAVQLEFCS